MVDKTMSKEISRESKKNMNQIAQTLYLTTDFSLLIIIGVSKDTRL